MSRLKKMASVSASHVAIADMCRQLEVKQIVDRVLGWTERPGVPSPGDQVVYMIIDILNRRTPLYKLESKLRNLDVEALFGEGISADDFNDDRLGRTLDSIHQAGAKNLFTKIAFNSLTKEKVQVNGVYADTSSISLEGSYSTEEQSDDDEPKVIRITFGYSKDSRPDLKQFVIGLVVNTEGIPIWAEILDGNKSDKVWLREVMTKIKDLNSNYYRGDLVFVADSALITEENLRHLRENEIPFISRCPDNYLTCQRAMKTAWQENKWEDIGAFSADKRAAYYKGCSYLDIIDGTTYRFVVLHTVSRLGQIGDVLKKRLQKQKLALESAIKVFSRKVYSCEPDANQALEEFISTNTGTGILYKLSGKVIETQRIVRGRGRPKADEVLNTKSDFHIEVSLIEPTAEELKTTEELDSTFVLISSLTDETTHSLKDILAEYKGRIKVEQRFAFIKDANFIDGIFLKKQSRIEALGILFLVAGLVAALMERRVRKSLSEANDTVIIDERKRVASPTIKQVIEELKESIAITVVRYIDQATEIHWHIQDYNEETTVGKLMRHLGVNADFFIKRSPTFTQD